MHSSIMRTKITIIATALLVAVTVSMEKTIKSNSPLLDANIEALSQIEGAIITCGSHNWGPCHVPDVDVQLGGLILFYYCRWTGVQNDNCPWSYYLLNPIV